MFGHQFYPTPPEVIRKMIEPYAGKGNLLGKTILDPSAGKGDILNYIKKGMEEFREMPDMYAVEIDTNLQSILRENSIPVIGSDFLDFQSEMFFDLILMNPPFDKGDEHLLKAIEIAHNTDIVCLLNAETILNPTTRKRRQLLEYIENHGEYEILGNVFKNAERKTDVNVALVRLHIESQANNFDFSFKDTEREKIEFDESFIKNEVARNDKIGNLMIYFEEARAAYKKYIEAEKKWEYHTKAIEGGTYFNLKDFDFKDLSPEKRYNRFSSTMKLKMWKQVISKMGLERYMTNSMQQNFNAFIQQQSNMAFTKENVSEFINMLLMNSKNILDQAITEVFDMLTANYYTENRHYVEGWKTNDRYKVNRKIIAPTYVKWGEYMSQHDLTKYGDRFSMNYHGEGKYTDIDKVMCYISGKSYENIITISKALKDKFTELGYVGRGTFDNQCESTFFEIKFYKKGTVHLKFKEKWLWDEFNMRACANKNWLPDKERTEWENKRKKQEPEPQQHILALTA